jgi:hypothetical protein
MRFASMSKNLPREWINSIKFLSDMVSARVYRLAAAKIGVPDYRKLVDDKLETAADLYGSMMSSSTNPARLCWS